jgi:disulfide bond formation protein DsbB
MGSYAFVHEEMSEPAARAYAFTVLVTANLTMIFANRSRSLTLLASLRTPNPVLWAVTGVTLTMLALSLYLPALSGLFRFEPLPVADLGAAVGLGLASVGWFQLLKINNAKTRLVWIALALVSAAAVCASLGLTRWMALSGCELCVLQRLLFLLIAALALIAALPAGRRARWLPGGLALGLAALGLALAAYQSWLYRQPPEAAACADILARLMDYPLQWLDQQFPVVFQSNGVCVEQGLAMQGLPLSDWTLLAYAACLLLGVFALAGERSVRKQ